MAYSAVRSLKKLDIVQVGKGVSITHERRRAGRIVRYGTSRPDSCSFLVRSTTDSVIVGYKSLRSSPRYSEWEIQQRQGGPPCREIRYSFATT